MGFNNGVDAGELESTFDGVLNDLRADFTDGFLEVLSVGSGVGNRFECSLKGS